MKNSFSRSENKKSLIKTYLKVVTMHVFYNYNFSTF